MSNLKKALHTLLYDQFDPVDLELDSSDETYIEYIIEALVEKNHSVCPFKNYICSENCKSSDEQCNKHHLYITCETEKEKIWRHFIGIDED